VKVWADKVLGYGYGEDMGGAWANFVATLDPTCSPPARYAFQRGDSSDKGHGWKRRERVGRQELVKSKVVSGTTVTARHLPPNKASSTSV
jgi:hypothetical protein